MCGYLCSNTLTTIEVHHWYEGLSRVGFGKVYIKIFHLVLIPLLQPSKTGYVTAPSLADSLQNHPANRIV
jgi:hypothetical protein